MGIVTDAVFMIENIEKDIHDLAKNGFFYYVCYGNDYGTCSIVQKHFKDKGYEVEITESKNYVDTYSGKKTFKIVVSW